jgi:PAS domain S-box-containing protein
MTPLREVEATVASACAVKVPGSSNTSPACNILIVDDEPSNLLALEAILEPLGERIVRAKSGVEALKHALKMEFCVVLLDVQMPEMDGLETATLLRRRPRTRDLPIIFLTAISKDDSWVARGYDVGAVDYLFKPYDPDALRTKVATFVELGRKNQIIRAQHEALRVGSERELADFKRWSERRYEDLANSMPQVVWTADASGTITYHNQRWAEVAGRDVAVDGEPSEFAAIAHPDDLDSFSTGWSSAVHAGIAWEAELRLGARGPGYRYHLVRAVPRHDERGKLIAWVGTATDIDARVRADRALRMLAEASHRLNDTLDEPRELEPVLRMALPMLGDGAILDIKGREGAGESTERLRVVAPGIDAALLFDPRFDLGPATVAYSGRAEVFLDVERERETERPLRESERDPGQARRGADHLRFLSELGVSAYICVPLLTRDRTIGTLTFVRLSKGQCFDEADTELAGDLARRIGVSIDNAWLHAATARRREELELANRSKDVFLATLSHELRTPLNAIVGWTDMMKKGAIAGDELGRAMDTIDRNAHALSGLVADLLDVSRIVTGTLKLDSKLVSLASIVEAAVLAARPQCASKRIRLELALDDRERGVHGDPGRIRQIIANLLSNAIKFTPEGGTIGVRMDGGGRELRLDDRTEEAPVSGPGADRVRVTVTDSGEGIAPEFLPHVFERFRQEQPGRAKGLGLGLAIVKHLVEEHGGSVSATSEGRGKGASIRFELPLAAGALPDAEEDRMSTGPIAEPDLASIHVLVVEDDPDGNELACAILERYGARVTSATTASAALDALDGDDQPHILVSDIGLPDMDGMDLIKTVRERTNSAGIPAVALTAYASRQDATRAIAAGFDAHVAKPVQPSTLGSVILRLLSRSAALPESGDTAADRPPSSSAA